MKILVPSELDTFKTFLARKILTLRDENNARLPKEYDLDITPHCNGVEFALDEIDRFITDYEKNPPR